MKLFDTILQSDFLTAYAKSIPAERAAEKTYILSERFFADVKGIRKGIFLPEPPEQIAVPKKDGRLRKVYQYTPTAHAMLAIINTALHKYDDRFADSCYSHVLGRGQKRLLQKLMYTPNLAGCAAYVSDLSGFGDSIDRELLKKDINDFFTDDPELSRFLCRVADDGRYYADGVLCQDGCAVKSGNPLTSFFEDLFLLRFDLEMEKRTVLYCRFCDNFIFYAESLDAVTAVTAFTEDFLVGRKLVVNRKKSAAFPAGEPIQMLGATIQGNSVIQTEFLKCFKQFIARKKTQTFQMQRRYGLSGQEAMEWFLKLLGYHRPETIQAIVNGFLCYEEALIIDRFIQESLRQIASGKKTNAKYRIRYEDMKKAGYYSLAHEYYRNSSE